MKKTNPAAELEAALAGVESGEAALTHESKVIADCRAEQHALQNTIEISNPQQVARMTELLTIAQVGNPRRTRRLEEHGAALQELVGASVHFAKEALGPRCRDLESRALAKVEAKLKDHFPEIESSRAAAQHSPEFLELAPIQELVVIRDYGRDGAIRQAKLLLDAWAAADAFEQKFLA